MRLAVPLFILTVLVWTGVVARAGGPAQDGARFFEEKIRPILADNCFQCHSHTAEKIKGGLVLDSREGALTGGETGAAIVPGEPGKSLLLEAVAQTNKDLIMPPKKSDRRKLSDVQIALLTEWVKMGAPYPPATRQKPAVRAPGALTERDRQWWAFQPLAKVQPPEVEDAGWGVNGIDRFVFQKLAAAGLQPAPRAAPEQLVRRLFYDLTGLPPTPAQSADFIRASARDPRGAAEELIDQLLASPRHGEHAARSWLDLVRYAESDGFKIDAYRPHAWRYRDYVIASFNSDKPYARFVQEQLAGDELFPGDLEALAATGFLRLGIYEYNSRDAATQWANMLNDITDVTADVFLGLSVQCARCHDHKFDPIQQKDYYRWQAFFAPLLMPEEVRVATPELRARHEAQLRVWEEKTAALREEIAALEDPAKERAAKFALKKFPPEVQAIFNKPMDERTPWETQIADLVFRQVTYEWERLADNHLKAADKSRFAALQKQLAAFDKDRPPELPVVPSVSDVGPLAPPTRIPKKPALGDIAPGFPSVLHPEPATIEPMPPDSTGRRAALARWLTKPEHPLTARLIVNRIWQQHFGRGLAASANDFGHLGEPPTHPELLDWLAARFLANGGNLKKLHRLILRSATYQQSATPSPDTAARARTADPENRLLWHTRTRRLAAEQIRDSILALTGELDLRAGGPSVEPTVPRRTIYTTVRRNTRDPLLEVFDAPEAFASVPSREVTTTSTQALQMLNSNVSFQRAAAFARRLRTAGGGEKEQVIEAYRLAFGRLPASSELESALAFLARQSAALEKPRAEEKPAALVSERMSYRDGRAAVFPQPQLRSMEIPGQPALRLTDFTIEGFVVLKAVSKNEQISSIAAQGDGDRQAGWAFGVAGQHAADQPQTLVFLRHTGDALRHPAAGGPPGQGGARLQSGLKIETGRPYFVALSVRQSEPTAQSVTFFAKDLSDDDQPMQSIRVPLDPGLKETPTAPAGVTLGAGFHGLLDDLRLSNAALPAEQLLLNNPAVAESTVGYWKFERDPGEWRDSSPRHADIKAPMIQPQGIDPRTAALTDFCHVLLNSNEFLYLD